MSFITETERKERFGDAQTTNPGNMVTTSTFIRDFFPTISQKISGELDAERAWFGIRSLIKGGHASLEYGQEVKIEHFSQLNKASNNIHMIPRRYTAKYFTDDELRNLIKIYESYQKWLKKKNRYDDLDIVYRALRHYSGEGPKKHTLEQERFEEYLSNVDGKVPEILKAMNFNRDKLLFKPEFYNNIEKAGKNADFRERLHGWIKKLDREEVSTARRAGKTEKVVIYKDELTKSARIFFSKIKIRDSFHKHRYVIYGFELEHDKQNNFLRKILREKELLDEDVDVNIKVDDVDSKDDTPGVGPVKPWPDADSFDIALLNSIKAISNIDLDDEQRRTLLAQQPLLIDGLAGTGKTSALAYRSVMRTAFSSEGSRILVLASKSHVVSRLVDNHREYTRKGKWEKTPFKTEYIYTQNVNSEEGTPCASLKQFNSEIMSKDIGFDEIILDECQDITYIEFQFLLRLCKAHDARRMIFAGDPLQTLNPTGFDWNRIVSMFIELGELDNSQVVVQRFHKNYRSSRQIVHFANAIQKHRSKVLSEREAISMIPDKEEGIRARVIPYDLNNENHKSAIKTILKNSERGKATVVVWAPDDAAIFDMLSGNNPTYNDPILESIFDEIEDKEERAYRTQGIHLYSASSIKGDEKDVIVLYNFASSESARKSLDSLTTKIEDLSPVDRDELISVRYAFSRLYVGATRAFDQVYFIENPEGVGFWKQIQLLGDDGTTKEPEVFLDFDWGMDPLEAAEGVDLKPSEEVSISNFKEKMRKFRQNPEDQISLEGALGLGRDLYNEKKIEKKDLAEVEGEFALIRSRDPSIEQKRREQYLNDATNHFIDAGKFDKLAPIYFHRKEYSTCKQNLENYNKPFHQLIKFYCKIRVKDVLDGDEVINALQQKVTVPNNWIGFVDFEDVCYQVKDWCLKNNTIDKLLLMIDPYSIKNKSLFETNELISANENSNSTKIHILEYRELYMTTLWNSGYVDSVISHSDSIEDPEQREDFLLEKKKLLKDDRVFNLQIRKARIEQLKTMDSIISPKRGRGIFDKMKDLLNIRLSKVGKLKNDVQFYALWLAIQIANDEIKSDLDERNSELPIHVRRFVISFIKLNKRTGGLSNFYGIGEFVENLISALVGHELDSTTNFAVFNWLDHEIVSSAIEQCWSEFNEDNSYFFIEESTGFDLYVENKPSEKLDVANQVEEFILSFIDYSLRTTKPKLAETIQENVLLLSRATPLRTDNKEGLKDIQNSIVDGLIDKYKQVKKYKFSNSISKYIIWIIETMQFGLSKETLQKLQSFQLSTNLNAYVERELWRLENRDLASLIDKNTLIVIKHVGTAAKYCDLLESFGDANDGKHKNEVARIKSLLPMDEEKAMEILGNASSLEEWCNKVREIAINNPVIVAKLFASNNYEISKMGDTFNMEDHTITDEDIDFLSNKGIGKLNVDINLNLDKHIDLSSPFSLLLCPDLWTFLEMTMAEYSTYDASPAYCSEIFEIIYEERIRLANDKFRSAASRAKFRRIDISPLFLQLYVVESCIVNNDKKSTINRVKNLFHAYEDHENAGYKFNHSIDDINELWDLCDDELKQQ